MIKSNRGQLSIFMGITLILVMGMLAFIINVGLFVKAKINLQNAVDAAAFSGAAVQARQLTNISYVNWEMRNTYKEWMFKYYVLGQLGLVKGDNNLSDAKLNASARVSFLLRTPSVAGEANSVGFDKFNVPTICIHNNASTDICPIYALPGIPRFPAIGVAGISEIHEAFVNKLVEEKGENCSARTQINFLAALSWAYSSGISAMAGAPLIATNRAGAWPESLELAMRMRNLEMIMNRPPVQNLTYTGMSDLTSTGAEIGLNERPLKAFMSAFRNLGGGKYKDALQSGGDVPADELPRTFVLSELAPQPYEAGESTVSGFLIPPNSNYPTGGNALSKYYVDLQAVPVNLATMFTTFVTGRNEYEPSVASEASCRVSKSAIPIPGYLMGFVKNPSVLTYYAVKGEAEFTGLFFPKVGNDGARSFKLTAYAAAKPFGGRIGPKLYGFAESDKGVIARLDENSKSASYLSGIDVGLDQNFKPGMPIPVKDFWADGFSALVGGVPGLATKVTFGIPNMIYDFSNDSELAAQNGGGGATKIQIVGAQSIAGSSTPERFGLYQSSQMKKLKAALGGDFTGRAMTVEDLMKALVTSRQVTRYDAANFLIPDFNRSGTSNPEENVAPTVKNIGPTGGGVGFNYRLFAPLVGTNLLYKTNTMIGSIINSYMEANKEAVKTYLQSLLEVGQSIYALPSGVGAATNVNAQAAQSIHANAGVSSDPFPPPLTSPDPLSDVGCNKKDMASKFNHFFRAQQAACGIIPLERLMIDYIDKKNQNGGDIYYVSSYLNTLPPKAIMTAYFPGPRQGTNVDPDATAKNPIGVEVEGGAYSTRRNFYSTKLIPLNKLFLTANGYTQDVLLESDIKSPEDAKNLTPLNPLKDDGTTGLNIPFYKDF